MGREDGVSFRGSVRQACGGNEGATGARGRGVRPSLRRYLGTIGFFLCLMFLFVRFVPMIAMFEMKTLLPEAKVQEGSHGH